jgi:hypothetical protein
MNKQLLDVASTDAAPVNCLKVNILFSAIGDFTDTVILQQMRIIMDLKHHRSNAITDTGRLMIKAADNVF